MQAARSSIAGLMGSILVVSLALAALLSYSSTWSGVTAFATCSLIGLAAVGAACRTGSARAGWLGFALLGGGYLTLLCLAPGTARESTTRFLEWLRPRILAGQVRQADPGLGGMDRGFLGSGYEGIFGASADPFTEVGHCLISLVLATAGGFAAHFLFGTPSDAATARELEPVLGPRAKGPWLSAAAIMGMVGTLLALCFAFVGLGLKPGLWPALACLLIWTLLGLAVVGAIHGQGRSRGRWLGAAVFGIGYCALVAGNGGETPSWPRSAADRFLGEIRRIIPSARAVFPPGTAAGLAATERLRQILDQPITLRFPDETPLEDVLKAIQSTARGPDGRAIQIYLDPLGLGHDDMSTSSPVSINLEHVRLGTCLRLALSQLGLDYILTDGVLVITSEERILQTTPQDAFTTVGHCLLAWLAAVTGAALVPLVTREGSKIK